MKSLPKLGFALIGATTVASMTMAQTGSNAVPGSRAGQAVSARTITQLLPNECVGIPATTLRTGSGTVAGTTASDLVLGSAVVDSLTGSSANDCLVAGAGNDTLNGGSGTDVCIGGPGTDTFISCETQIQ
jgi:Ca2+-binding RTX toxin-like protein